MRIFKTEIYFISRWNVFFKFLTHTAWVWMRHTFRFISYDSLVKFILSNFLSVLYLDIFSKFFYFATVSDFYVFTEFSWQRYKIKLHSLHFVTFKYLRRKLNNLCANMYVSLCTKKWILIFLNYFWIRSKNC